MVIDLLGSCLADLFDECGQRFSLKTVLMLADQLLRRLEAIHEKGYIHRDIKPDNIMMGRGSWQDIVYIVDFGLCKQHQLPIMLQPRPYHATGIFYGTSRYASINTHRRVGKCLPRYLLLH
jgi:serine/threonine protein kinase